MDPVTIAQPRPAATVVLLRDGQERLEVLLVRRHDNVAFMGGAHVFPGGRVESTDTLPDTAIDPALDASIARMPDDPLPLAIGFHVAAMRELFEEAGILLARDVTGTLVALDDDEAAQRARIRADVTGGTLTFTDFLRRRGWHLAFDALAYVAHWVTPAIETKRFDTRFFLAAAPPAQVASHDAGETTDSVWMRPSEALVRCLDGDIALPPPTWTMLRWLEGFPTVDAAMAWARAKPVPRVEPGFEVRGDTRLVLLPGDPRQPAVPGFDAREKRFILSAGRWQPVEAD